MDKRHIHILKLINTMIVPKVNELLERGKAPLIVNVEVDALYKSTWGDTPNSEYVSIMIHYKNPKGGKYVSVSSISYPISCMIATVLPYVLTGGDNINTTIINFLKDNMDSSTFKFIGFNQLESFNYYMKLLQDRVYLEGRM